MLEQHARQSLAEAQALTRPPAARPDRASAARDHELARMKAKLLPGETAGAQLTERLRFAHQQNGKISLDALGSAVGASKATLSKVFNGRMQPAWALVRKLGLELNVPPSLVNQEWLPLWIAADEYRRKLAADRSSAAAASPISADPTASLADPPGHVCPKCGSWVVDSTRHAGWHMAMEPGGQPPDTESMGEGWNSRSQEYNLLREAFSTDTEQ